jgi:hypothetical protein
LQYPLGEPHNGRMRDEGVRVLLKELAAILDAVIASPFEAVDMLI